MKQNLKEPSISLLGRKESQSACVPTPPAKCGLVGLSESDTRTRFRLNPHICVPVSYTKDYSHGIRLRP